MIRTAYTYEKIRGIFRPGQSHMGESEVGQDKTLARQEAGDSRTGQDAAKANYDTARDSTAVNHAEQEGQRHE